VTVSRRLLPALIRDEGGLVLLGKSAACGEGAMRFQIAVETAARLADGTDSALAPPIPHALERVSMRGGRT
jgi:hypothetical protein